MRRRVAILLCVYIAMALSAFAGCRSDLPVAGPKAAGGGQTTAPAGRSSSPAQNGESKSNPALPSAPDSGAEYTNAGIAADSVVAILKQGSTATDAESLADRTGTRLVYFLPEVCAAELGFSIGDSTKAVTKLAGKRRYISTLSPSAVPGLERIMARVAADPAVASVEPHYFGCMASVTMNDPGYPFQYDSFYKYLDPVSVWNVTTGTGNVTIAVIDSGVDYGNPDFIGRIMIDSDPNDGVPHGGKDFIDPPAAGDGSATPGNGIDDDGDFLIDEGARHGSQVAGVALAKGGNSVGIAGMDWNAKILSLRVGPANGEDSGISEVDCARAMLYTLSMKDVCIINISLVFPNTSILLGDATRVCTEYGKLVIAAAGNEGRDTPLLTAPAYYPDALAVGGTENGISLWGTDGDGSNYGAFLDILAPAKAIYTINSDGVSRGYTYVNGTSMAAPIIAGLAGLILSQHPGYTGEDLREAILGGAISMDTSYPLLAGKLGKGRTVPAFALNAGPTSDLVFESVRPAGLVTSGIHSGSWQLDLSFNRNLDPRSATDASHYSLSQSLEVRRAILLSDGRTVRLLTGQQYIGLPCTVTVSGLSATDGHTLSPDGQSRTFYGTPALPNFAAETGGAIATATKEYNAFYRAQRAIDPDSDSYWFAEIGGGDQVELDIELSGLESVNRVVLVPRPIAGGETYTETLEIWGAGMESAVFGQGVGDTRYKLASGVILSDGNLATCDFPPILARYIILRFTAGNDGKLDSDGLDNGVSVARIYVSRELDSTDIYAPYVSAVSPAQAPLGATVRILGDSFLESPPGGVVSFGGVEAVVLGWHNNAITALVPYNPLSLPVQFPRAIPGDATASQQAGDPAPSPPDTQSIIPPEEDAESGDLVVSRDGFNSNPVYFTVAN